jgi:hypothetical protein
VIHGWFVQPRPFVRGPLPAKVLTTRIAELGAQLGSWLGDMPVAGVLALAFEVDRRGAVHHVRVLSDTTRVPHAHERERARLVRRMRQGVASWTFGKQRRDSHVTLPIVFERG